MPSRRALRDDPGFDAIVQALYANVPDYDLQENAYSASVAQVKKGEDAEEKEREREAKRRRKEEAAALREKMKAEEAERRARARAEAEVAAAAAAEQRARQLAEREAAEAHAAAVAAAKAAATAPSAGPEPHASLGGAAGDDDDAQLAPAKRPVGRPRSTQRGEAKATSFKATGNSVQVVAAFSDDFAGLYASRAVDDRARAELDAEGGTGAGILTYNLELRGAPFADSRTPPAIPSPHVSVPAGATLGVVKKIVGSQCGCSHTRVMIFGGEPGAEVVLDASTALRTALWPQLNGRNGSNELVLLYALQ